MLANVPIAPLGAGRNRPTTSQCSVTGKPIRHLRKTRDKFTYTMLSFEDKRWQNLEGGYREKFDPRPQLSKLLANNDTKVAWHELWEGLHHQGDIGEASYAAVPELVRIYRERRELDWNTYAIVGVVELAVRMGKTQKCRSG